MQHIFGRLRNSEEEKWSDQPSIIELKLDYAQLEQINSTRRRKINPKTINQHNKNITNFYEWVGIEVEKKPDHLSFSVGDFFVDINYTTFDNKEYLLKELLKSR